MSHPASSLKIGVYALPPSGAKCRGDQDKVDEDISFEVGFEHDMDLETLFASEAIRDDFNGALYVPQLAVSSSSSCIAEIEDLIPSNVTRLQDLPASSCPYIAFVPWVSRNCTRQFVNAARRDDASAAVVYLASSDSTTTVPAADSADWEAGDGSLWDTEETFPIYAIPGGSGKDLGHWLGQYSGNLSDAPHSDQLAQQYNINSQIRVFATVHLEKNGDVLPRLWIFLLVLLVTLVSGVIVSAITSRILQRRRRQDLERRIAAGEVDLEMLHVKRLNVPQSVLDKMPLYTYDDKSGPPKPDDIDLASRGSGEESSKRIEAQDPDTRSPARVDRIENSQHPDPSYSQSTCAICLDDFVSGESTVRELPCRHIFHPECIDLFLLQNSSLCPVCKSSALPPGYCPEEITNSMVHQERIARRRQERAERQNGERERSRDSPEQLNTPLRRFSIRLRRQLGDTRTRSRSRSTSRPPSQANSRAPGRRSSSRPASTSQTRTHDHSERLEIMRRRALQMLGDERMVADEHREQQESAPRWRRLWDRVFVGIR